MYVCDSYIRIYHECEGGIENIHPVDHHEKPRDGKRTLLLQRLANFTSSVI